MRPSCASCGQRKHPRAQVEDVIAPIAKPAPKPTLAMITDIGQAIREYGDTYRGRAAIAAQFNVAATRVTLACHAMRAK